MMRRWRKQRPGPDPAPPAQPPADPAAAEEARPVVLRIEELEERITVGIVPAAP